MFKSRKLDLYELNIDGVIYWKKTIHPETKEVIFVKHKSDSYTLFLDKLGNPKDMPQINGSYYLDMVSGRLLNISENDNYVIINPSNIYIPKNKFIKDKGTLEKFVKFCHKMKNLIFLFLKMLYLIVIFVILFHKEMM